jgi:hypothetical protein
MKKIFLLATLVLVVNSVKPIVMPTFLPGLVTPQQKIEALTGLLGKIGSPAGVFLLKAYLGSDLSRIKAAGLDKFTTVLFSGQDANGNPWELHASTPSKEEVGKHLAKSITTEATATPIAGLANSLKAFFATQLNS